MSNLLSCAGLLLVVAIVEGNPGYAIAAGLFAIAAQMGG